MGQLQERVRELEGLLREADKAEYAWRVRLDELENAVATLQREAAGLQPTARVRELTEAIQHVVNDSPGTPDSVKRYLLRAVEGSWGKPYEDARLAVGEPPE